MQNININLNFGVHLLNVLIMTIFIFQIVGYSLYIDKFKLYIDIPAVCSLLIHDGYVYTINSKFIINQKFF